MIYKTNTEIIFVSYCKIIKQIYFKKNNYDVIRYVPYNITNCHKILLDMHGSLNDIFIAVDIRPKSLPYPDLYIIY